MLEQSKFRLINFVSFCMRRTGFSPLTMAIFILEDALSVWTNLGKHLLLVWLFVSSIKTGTRRIIRLDKLFSAVRRSRRITEDNSSRRIMRPLV